MMANLVNMLEFEITQGKVNKEEKGESQEDGGFALSLLSALYYMNGSAPSSFLIMMKQTL